MPAGTVERGFASSPTAEDATGMRPSDFSSPDPKVSTIDTQSVTTSTARDAVLGGGGTVELVLPTKKTNEKGEKPEGK
jgi:hypothetical protein